MTSVAAAAPPLPAAPPAPPAPRLLDRPHRAFTVGAVALVWLIAFEALAVTTAMPTVARALDGLALYGLAFGMPMAAGVVGMVVSGIWSDARGPSAPMWHGVAWFVVGLLVTGSAPTMEVVVAGRVVQGLGGGLLSVALYVVVARVYPASLHPRVFAAFSAAWVLPSIVGPAVAGLVAEHVGWRWVFLAVPALALPAALLLRPALAGLPRTRARVARGSAVRVAWAAGAAGGVALLHSAGQQRGPVALLLTAGGIVALVASVPRLLPAGFHLARAGMPAVVALRGLAAAAFTGAEVFVPLMLSRERGLSPATAGLVLTASALTWSAGSWFQGRQRQPLSRTALLRLGMTLIGASVALAALTVSPDVPVLVGIAGWSLAGFGMGVIYPTLSVLTLELSGEAEQGRNSSALQLGESLFAATVLAVGGAIFAATTEPGPGSYLAGFAVAGGMAVLGVGVAGRAGGRPGAARPGAPV
jgi:MFS family permease